MSTGTAYCVKCGYRIDADPQFCPQCGEPRRQGVPSAPPQETGYRWMEDQGGSRSGNLPGAGAQPPQQQWSPPQQQQQQQQWSPPPPQQQQQQWSPPQQQQQWSAPQPVQSYAQPAPYVVHHQIVHPPSGVPSAAMGIGITAVCFMVMGLIPCLGWLNYFTIFLGAFGGMLNLICIFVPKFGGARGKLIIGMVLGFLALFIGFIRLVIGGGCI